MLVTSTTPALPVEVLRVRTTCDAVPKTIEQYRESVVHDDPMRVWQRKADAACARTAHARGKRNELNR
jgi:hypothetical protein